LIAIFAWACKGKENELPPEVKVLNRSVAYLQIGDYLDYVKMIHFSTPPDSLGIVWRTMAVKQHTEHLCQKHGSIVKILHHSTEHFTEDSLVVNYYLHFADGDSLDCVQPMILRNDEWRMSY
jgi:hypothetical protein